LRAFKNILKGMYELKGKIIEKYRNCILKNFIICILELLLGPQNQEA
jgi:hypothetical protein